jgi:hypothetical protein
MALAATSVWEMRDTGANTNGGFYKSDAGTTDYSQQDAAQLALTDLASDGAGTGISSATGGFTAAMVGNGIYITGGTGFTTGWYEIITHTDTNNIAIDRSAGASKTGGTGNVGGAVALPVDAMFELMTAGSFMWIKAGTYTFTEAVDALKDGSLTNPNRVQGYNATRGDAPEGDNRPLFAMGTYYYATDNYWYQLHIRCTKSGTGVCFKTDTAGAIVNVKMEISGTGSTAGHLQLGGAGGVIQGCETTSPASSGSVIGIRASTDSLFKGNWVHDYNSGVGMQASTDCDITFNTIRSVPTGINSVSPDHLIENNTIDNSSVTAILVTGGGSKVINNNLTNSLVGVTGDTDIEMLDFNNYHNNGTDVVNTVKGANATANDPEYPDAANGDLSTTLDSSDAGPFALFGTSGYKFKQGADQGAAAPATATGHVTA